MIIITPSTSISYFYSHPTPKTTTIKTPPTKKEKHTRTKHAHAQQFKTGQFQSMIERCRRCTEESTKMLTDS